MKTDFTTYTDEKLKHYLWQIEQLPITRILHENFIQDYQSALAEATKRGLKL